MKYLLYTEVVTEGYETELKKPKPDCELVSISYIGEELRSDGFGYQSMTRMFLVA